MRTSGEYAKIAEEELDTADQSWLEMSDNDEVSHRMLVDYSLRVAQVNATLSVAAALVNLGRIQSGPL